MSSEDFIHVVGNQVVVTFEIEGDYMPEIRFFKGKREIKPSAKVQFNIDTAAKKGEICILKSKIADEGKYTLQLISQQNTVVKDAGFNIFVKGYSVQSEISHTSFMNDLIGCSLCRQFRFKTGYTKSYAHFE